MALCSKYIRTRRKFRKNFVYRALVLMIGPLKLLFNLPEEYYACSFHFVKELVVHLTRNMD